MSFHPKMLGADAMGKGVYVISTNKSLCGEYGTNICSISDATFYMVCEHGEWTVQPKLDRDTWQNALSFTLYNLDQFVIGNEELATSSKLADKYLYLFVQLAKARYRTYKIHNVLR